MERKQGACTGTVWLPRESDGKEMVVLEERLGWWLKKKVML